MSDQPQPGSTAVHQTRFSDDVIRKVFDIASNAGVPVRFLRLGAPRGFRDEIIRVTDNEGRMTEAFSLLLDRRIPQIEFVLADPTGGPFLNRMDKERKSLNEIWRVRRNILAFAKGLLAASRIRVQNEMQPLLVAFHRKPLLWNLSCAGSHYVVVRAYHEGASGHDDQVEDIVFRSGERVRLAESMHGYYESVRDDDSTRRITEESQLLEYTEWPTLFKGNAVWCQDTAERPSVFKMLSSREIHACEAAWLRAGDRTSTAREYFRPVSLRSVRSQPHDDHSGEFLLQLDQIHGPTAERLLFELQQIAANDDSNRELLKAAANTIVQQAIHALREFQSLSPELASRHPRECRLVVYPWRRRLREALEDAARYMTHDRALLRRCHELLQMLGDNLERNSVQPFRDAHLKNRLVSFPRGVDWRQPSELSKWISDLTVPDLHDWFLRNTFDIDFETAGYMTTGPDDALHIFFSPNTGWRSVQLMANDFRRVRGWWSDTRDLETTLLCRSFRELCRRIWYANVMPTGYQERYGIEPTDHFRRIAELVSERSVELQPISDLLEICRVRHAAVWPVPDYVGFEQRVIVDFLPAAGILHGASSDSAPTVFISSHHADYPHAHRLFDYLKENRITAFFCERSLDQLQDTNFGRQIDVALERCEHVVVVASKGEHAKSDWVEKEWRSFIQRNMHHSSKGCNVITVTVGSVPIAELPFSLQSYIALTLEDALRGKLLPYVQKRTG